MGVRGFLAAFFTLVICCVTCNGKTEINNERLDILENEVNTFHRRIEMIEHKFSMDKIYMRMKQERQLFTLKTELNKRLQKHVTEALSDILRGESIEDIIKSQVISETRHLKRDNHRMKRQFYEMKKTLGRVQADNNRYQDLLMRVGGEKGELISCSKCIESEWIDRKFSELDHGLGELNRTLMEQSDLLKSSGKEIDSGMKTTTQSPSTVSLTTTTLTTPETTTKPTAEMSQILIAPLWSSDKHQFRYVDINSNSLNMYSYLNLKYIISVVYISRFNSLLIGLREPDKIISSELNSTRVQTVRRNVRTFGMAADEERGVIFLTTDRPSYTISRMTLQGKNLTTLVSLESYRGLPLAIVVHSQTRMIFACNLYNLFSVSYDGSGLTTLDTGYTIYAVTLDVTQGVLYYGKGNTLMKKSLASNKTTEVTRLSSYIWNLIFYRDRVYYSSFVSSPGIVGEVIVGQDMEATTLQTVEVDDVYSYGICLIP